MKLDNQRLFISDCYIGGNWVRSERDETMSVVNPSSRLELGRIAWLSASQIRSAVAAANEAFGGWKWTAQRARSDALRRFCELIRLNRRDLATLIASEQGKPLTEALAEVDYGASFVDWFAAQAERMDGRTLVSHIDDAHLATIREPVGVAVLITPWNFPLAMITRKAAAALSVGCTVVVKPAHETPFSALALAQLADEAGFPPGVFNVVLGEPQMAMETLVHDSRVRVVSFTGSTRVGRLVTRAISEAGIKRVALELGGNAPFIVLSDADLEDAVRTAVSAKFQTSGQDCCAANRIFVARPLYERFVERYTQAVLALKVGDAFDESVDIGPLMHQSAVDITVARIEDARKKGARITAGGGPHENGGWFFSPTVVADARPGMRIYDEENFAPISAVMPFDSVDEVASLANGTEHGLAAYVCGHDVGVVFRLIRQLDFAMVSVNGAKFTGAPVPFGGMKSSGIGREGGAEGLDPFVETKYFCLGGLGLTNPAGRRPNATDTSVGHIR